MTKIKLWKEINKLSPNESERISLVEFENMKQTQPDKLMTYIDNIFYRLTVDRMKQLSYLNNKGEISTEYFKSDNLWLAWRQIRNKLRCSLGEYTAATNICKASEKKFTTGLNESDIESVYENIMIIAKVWYACRKDMLNAESRLNEQAIKENHETNIVESSDISSKEGKVQLDSLNDTLSSPDIKTQGYVPEKDEVEINKNNQHLTKGVFEKSNEEASVFESEFLSILQALQSSSKESVVNADSFGRLREYMHVDREIQKDLHEILLKDQSSNDKSLILLCGSVGDGKSHLLAYMKEKHPELLRDVYVHNDSTESFDPDTSSLETLEKILEPYDDGEQKKNTTVIAINLGVLHNFYTLQKSRGKFQNLCNFIDQSGIFDSNVLVSQSKNFKMLNFADTQPYELTQGKADSEFFMNLFDKITDTKSDNPFFIAWKNDLNKGLSSAAHVNYYLMQNQTIKISIIQTLIESMVKQKVFVSTRTFYNFIYEIIVPVTNSLQDEALLEVKVEEMLPNLLYGHPDRSPLLFALSENDPLKTRSDKTDRLLSGFILSSDSQRFVKDKLGELASIGAWKNVQSMGEKDLQIQYSALLLRQYELLNKEDYDESYEQFIKFLYAYYRGEDGAIGELFELVEDVIYAWKGSPENNFIFIDSPNKEFRMAVEVDLEPVVDSTTFASITKESFGQFIPSIRLGYSQNNEEFMFELDYKLYSLLNKVAKGYRPNRQDIQDTLQFSEFYDKVIKTADKTKQILLVHKDSGKKIKVKKPGRFSKAKYEVEKVN